MEVELSVSYGEEMRLPSELREVEGVLVVIWGVVTRLWGELGKFSMFEWLRVVSL